MKTAKKLLISTIFWDFDAHFCLWFELIGNETDVILLVFEVHVVGQNGECKYFREKRLVQKAWGFTHLYDNVPQRDKADARRCVRSSFSGGNGPYYRYHHGENLLSPEQQEEIMKIIAQYGSTDGIRFDHYVEAWDFG